MSIAQIPDTPKYTIKAVSAQTGIRGVTLRAWERRYRLVRPKRTAGNYRLYSDRDVALLRWLKERVAAGQSISAAAAELTALRRQGDWPAAPPALALQARATGGAVPAVLADRLYRALTTHDEAAALQIMSEASAAFEVAAICEQLVTPTLVAIGEGWARGVIRISTEHFASQFLRGRVLNLFQALPSPRGGPRVVVGCAPREMHDIGPLMLALFLRHAGYRVEFLGPDVHLDDLLVYVRAERPAVICLSANSEETALPLARVQPALNRMRPRPRFGYGGRAFNHNPDLRAATPGTFLGETASVAVASVRGLLAN